MTIFVCRVDGDTFWTEAECHYHVDLHHRDWGHAVCVRGTPVPFQCTICGEAFKFKSSCEEHILTEHNKSGDVTEFWTILTLDT